MTHIEIKWNGSIETEELIREHCHESVHSQFLSHQKQMGPILQELLISHENHSWALLKTHTQLLQFIKDYNDKYDADLHFGSFMNQGLHDVVSNPKILQWKQFLQFIELQDMDLNKIKSIQLLKKCGGRHREKYICCNMNWLIWKQRNFVITSEGVMYYKTQKQIKEFIPFDIGFQARNGEDIPGKDHLCIMLISNHRNLLVMAKDHFSYLQFLYFLKKGCREAAKNRVHRFDSFAPERKQNYVDFMVDGQQYFRSVAQGIEKANSELFIAGWWISPEFHLIRPCNRKNMKYRLDRLLQAAAQRGVKIFILVYYESSFLTNDSLYTKTALQSLHSNIKVIRHPLGVLPTLWSHHEKIIVIDQVAAFLGGLDLCYARYDSSSHLICDNDESRYPGIEYNNVRINDFTDVRNIQQKSIQRGQPRLPWHDVALRICGESVKDVTKHFIQYWNFANFENNHHQRHILTIKTRKTEKNIIERKLDQGIRRIREIATEFKEMIIRKKEEGESNSSDSQKNKTKPMDEDRQSDTQRIPTALCSNKNSQQKSHKRLSLQIDLTQRYQTENQGTDSIMQTSIQMVDEHQIVLKAKKYFVEQEKKESEISQPHSKNQRIEDIVHRIEKPDEQQIKEIRNAQEFKSQDYSKQQFRTQLNFIKQLRTYKRNSAILSRTTIPGWEQSPDHCQIVRSASHWSIGCNPSSKERSIQLAYVWIISQAKKFIYIENQFFISAIEDEKEIKNQVVQALYQRMKYAIEKKKKFKVIIMLPLIPGFAGQLDDSAAIVPRVVMHWQYKTISRHQNSLLVRLKRLTKKPEDYIQFYGLRQHGIVEGKPATQIIYLHSKLMIVDDQRAICGSANINDRSMQGSRDSEICCIVEGGQTVDARINGVKTKVGKNVHELRIRLWEEHFGLNKDECEDPLNQEILGTIKSHAKKNTEVYRHLFGCYPDDDIKTLIDLNSLKKEPSTSMYKQNFKHIIGNAVEFPLKFLQDENLMEGATLYPNNIST